MRARARVCVSVCVLAAMFSPSRQLRDADEIVGERRKEEK